MKYGFRKIEAIVGTLIFTVLFIFIFEVYISSPQLNAVLYGFIPHSEIITNNGILYIALGIIGATIMPHNLYLHSSIVQSRTYSRHNNEEKAQAIKFATIDSNIQLSIAFVVNCLLLVLGASLFFNSNADDLGGFYDLYHALKLNLYWVQQWCNHEYIICSCIISVRSKFNDYWYFSRTNCNGRIFKITHTKLVKTFNYTFPCCHSCYRMFNHFKGNAAKIEQLLVFSQVFLSIALPFCLIPLQLATSNKDLMGPFYNKTWVNIISWTLIIILSILNIYLIVQTFQELQG